MPVAALALLIGVAGCGGGGTSQRQTVNDYLDRVNAMQESSAPEFDRANRTYLAFSKGTLPVAKAKRELSGAERSMRAMRDRIGSAPAPPAAAELKRRLVAMFDADAAMAHEATLLASFVPAAQRAGKPLPLLAKRLSRSLRASKTAAQQEAALSAYAAGIGKVLGHLEPLHPPPLLIERQHEQVQHLEAVQGLAQRLVRALRAQDSALVARLLLRFRRLSASGASKPVTSGALRSYNRRAQSVRRAAAEVQVERARLERTLK